GPLHAIPQLVERIDPDAKSLRALHHVTGAVLVVPERAVGHLRLERSQRLALTVEVKETSAIPSGDRRPLSTICCARIRPLELRWEWCRKIHPARGRVQVNCEDSGLVSVPPPRDPCERWRFWPVSRRRGGA